MSQQLNFAEIKQRISVVKGAKLLGLTLTEDGESLRCSCPVCEGDNRTLSLLEETNTFKCFKSGKYGSVLDLVCHVKQIGLREAGKWLVEQEEEPVSTDLELPSLERSPQLIADHDEVKAIGLNPEVVDAIGAGFSKAGVLRGTIGFPCYQDGELVGYIGVPKGTQLKLPKNFKWEI